MAEKCKDFTPKKKERESCFKKTQFWTCMYISLTFSDLKDEKLRACFHNLQASAEPKPVILIEVLPI